MDTSTLTIFISVVAGLAIILVTKIYRDRYSIKQPKLSYNERTVLQANLDIELNKDDVSDRYIRAREREKKKDFRGAIKDINVILQHDKENLGLVFKRGLDKIKISDFKGATIDFSEVLIKDPADKYAFYYRGSANF